jgi:ABC-type nickel/cobalt efflux system permease component RcnA
MILLAVARILALTVGAGAAAAVINVAVLARSMNAQVAQVSDVLRDVSVAVREATAVMSAVSDTVHVVTGRIEPLADDVSAALNEGRDLMRRAQASSDHVNSMFEAVELQHLRKKWSTCFGLRKMKLTQGIK